MSKLSLTLACADYDRIMPLATGVVAPDGIDLTMILGEGGSWARRTELLGSVIADPSVDGGEGSIGATGSAASSCCHNRSASGWA